MGAAAVARDVDKLAQWPTGPAARRLWELVTSAVAKLPDARLAVLTSAGDPAHWAGKVIAHARADPLWRVQEVPGPSPWLSSERLAEQRRRLTESSYRRLFLNEWTTAEDRLASVDDLRACVTLGGPLDPVARRRYAIGLDVGLKHDRTLAAICHVEPLHDGEPAPEPEDRRLTNLRPRSRPPRRPRRRPGARGAVPARATGARNGEARATAGRDALKPTSDSKRRGPRVISRQSWATHPTGFLLSAPFWGRSLAPSSHSAQSGAANGPRGGENTETRGWLTFGHSKRQPKR